MDVALDSADDDLFWDDIGKPPVRVHRVAMRFASTLARRIGALAVFLVWVLPTANAHAAAPKFSSFDVPTVFYISKSDDRNRVDYGIHLDEHCSPADDDAVFPYWREFENSPPIRIHSLGMFEFIAYGVSEQRALRKTPVGGMHTVTLRQVKRISIRIFTKKEPDGHCSAQARAIIHGKESELTHVYVKLGKGGLTPSVEHIEMHGKDLDSGQEVIERMAK
jgi:hypothetical protein